MGTDQTFNLSEMTFFIKIYLKKEKYVNRWTVQGIEIIFLTR